MKWFHERLYAHHAQMLSVDAVLYEGRTAFQEVLIFENRVFGRVMALDWVILGTGGRNGKIRIDPVVLSRVPRSRVADLAVPPRA